MPDIYFPNIFVGEEEKTKEWCEKMVNAIVHYLNYDDSPVSNVRFKDVKNYELYNGTMDQKEYTYLTEQYGTPYPARLVHYPITSRKVDLLIGEELRRPLDFKVNTVNKEAINRKEQHRTTMLMNELLKDVNEELKQATGMEINMEGQNMPIPDDIEQYMRYTYKELIEETVQDGLNYIIDKYNVKEVFKNGFKDFLITAKEFYKIGIKNGDPHVRRVDPRSVIYDASTESEYLDDAQWVGEERWLTPNEIIDEFRDELGPEEIKEIEKLRQATGYTDLSDYNKYFDWIDYDNSRGTRIRVVHAEWKSIKALKFKISPNKFNPEKSFSKQVPDNYKKKKGERIETKFIDDVWEASMIGGKMLVNWGRRPNQVRSVDDPGSTPLSYTGAIKNLQGGRGLSLVDMLRNVQTLYNIVMYHIELALSRAGGKAVVYDVSQLPSDLGMNMQDIFYHLKADGVIPINSKDESGGAAAFNQFQQIDFTLSNSVQQLINLKLMLEESAGQISGVSRQREGAVQQYEYVGNVQRSVVQSATVTEGWFYQHSIVKKKVLERLCNLMKLSWAGGKKAAHILGDGAYKALNVLPDVALNDYGVFVGDSGKDDALRQTITQLSQAALQNGSVGLLDVLKVVKAESMTEAEHILEKGMEQMQQQQQATQQAQQQMMEMEAQQKEADRQHELQKIDLQNQAKIQVAKIAANEKIEGGVRNDKLKRDLADLGHRMDMNKTMLKGDIDEQLAKKAQDAAGQESPEKMEVTGNKK